MTSLAIYCDDTRLPPIFIAHSICFTYLFFVWLTTNNCKFGVGLSSAMVLITFSVYICAITSVVLF